MKRPAAVTVLLFVALGAGVEARDLPTPTPLVSSHKASNFTPYIRGAGRKLPEAMRMDSNDRHRPLRQTHGVRGMR